MSLKEKTMTCQNETNLLAPSKSMVEKYHDDQRNRMAFKPPVVMLDKSDVTNWSAKDVKLLLDTVRITAPYTPDQLKKIQIFIGLLVEIKEPS
jgi:hypothetical protein